MILASLDEVEAEIYDKNSRRKSIEHYLALLEERKDAIMEYDVRLWHGMVEFVTVYRKDDILFTMKDGTKNQGIKKLPLASATVMHGEFLSAYSITTMYSADISSNVESISSSTSESCSFSFP